jgi:glycosyltransferase involved in cell wall biosynthesis
MKVSIVTITYNSAETLVDTIESVAQQSYSNIEYIVVDGVSKDGTLDIVKEYKSHIHTFISEKDKGIYDAMNKGVALATGDIIGILNSDDFYADKQVIEDVVRVFESSKADAVYADLLYVHRDKKDKVLRTWKAGPYKRGLFLKGWMPPHPTFFVKRSVYEKWGSYTTALRSAADYELMLRFIHKHHIEVAYLPRVITHMRAGGQSNVSFKNRVKANMEDRAAWKMNQLKPGLFTLTRKPLSKIFQFLKK